MTNRSIYLWVMLFVTLITSLASFSLDELQREGSQSSLSSANREILEAAHPLLPVITASATSEPFSAGPLGSVWLHVHVDRSPVKAWAEAWTTSGEAEDSPRVDVGSIRLRLEWDLFEDSTVYNTSFHSQYEWSTNAAFKKAKATAWTINPNIGPLSAETKF